MPHRILIIEDERIIADTLGIILRKRGFECDVAYSAGEALAAAKKAGPELILGDISLPDGSGLTVISEISKLYPQCRVILLTGRYSNLRGAQDWVRSHTIPARILTKPLLPALLLEEMDDILRA